MLPYYIYIEILVQFSKIIYKGFFLDICNYEMENKKAIIIGALVWKIAHMNPLRASHSVTIHL